MPAFEQLPGEPSNMLLGNFADLGRMSSRQFEEEQKYWRGIQALGGYLQLDLSRIMLTDVTEATHMCRESTKVPPELQEQFAFGFNINFRIAEAGLALSALIRRAPARIAEEGPTPGNPSRLTGMELVLGDMETPPIAALHYQRDDVQSDIINSYDPETTGTSWHADGALAVEILDHSAPSTAFLNRHRGIYGEDYDPSGMVTLKPKLMVGYIQSS